MKEILERSAGSSKFFTAVCKTTWNRRSIVFHNQFTRFYLCRYLFRILLQMSQPVAQGARRKTNTGRPVQQYHSTEWIQLYLCVAHRKETRGPHLSHLFPSKYVISKWNLSKQHFQWFTKSKVNKSDPSVPSVTCELIFIDSQLKQMWIALYCVVLYRPLSTNCNAAFCSKYFR